MTSSPEVINALSNQLVYPVAVLCADQILYLLQFPLQLPDARIPNSRCDPTLQYLLHSVLNVFQVPFNLANCIIPQLEARVTLDTLGEVASEAASAFIALLPRCSLPAFTHPCYPVTLGHL